MNKGRRESKRGGRKEDSDSGSETGSSYDSDSDCEYSFLTPKERLKEAIRSKKDERKKGVYKEKINLDE